MDISRGFTFDTDESINAAKLNGLVDDARISNIVQADLESGLHFALMTAPGSPVADDMYIENDGSLRVYDGSSWIHPVLEKVTFTNNSGSTLVTGDVVVLDTSASGQVKYSEAATGAWDHTVIGPCAEVSKPGDPVDVFIKGPALTRVKHEFGHAFVNGDVVVGPSREAVGACIVREQFFAFPSDTRRASMVGSLLEALYAAGDTDTTLRWVMLRK